MFTKEINDFLRNAKKVRNFSFVESIYDEETHKYTYDTVRLSMNFNALRVYAAKGSGGNCILFSDDRLLMERLYHLCRLFNYDVHHEEYGRFGTLMLVGCDGSCSAMGGAYLYARVNGTVPDHLFDKKEDDD